MKKTEKMRAGCLYLMKSMACSNTVYFEQLIDTKKFLELANQHLKDYMYIHEYMLCKDGWVFVARIKSAKAVREAYIKKRLKYKKLPKELAIWKIISEQIRLFIAEYVTNYNSRTGRKGVLVRRSYERYYFDTVQEAKMKISRIRRRIVGLQQPQKMYRAKKGHYRIPKKLGAGGIYLSSKRKRRVGVEGRNLLEFAVFQRITKKVVTKSMKKIIKRTKSAHKPPIPDS